MGLGAVEAGLPGAVRLLPAALRGSVEAPPSKSYTHRALLASLLAGGGVVERPLDSLDTRATAGAVEALGGRVEWLQGRVEVEAPEGLSWGCCIDAGESGTTARLVTGVAALLDKPVTIHGRGRLHRRPVLPLLRSLSLLGVSSVSSGPGGCCPPHTVRGPARPGVTVVDAGASSQFLSAVLYTGAGLGDWVEARVAALESRPYVDITVRVLEAYGAAVEREGYRVFRVRGPLRPTVYRVPGDWSSAAPLLAAAAASGGEARVEGLDPGDP
ncbi:MAG: 3-phosphoshikimate 1-carboxyvinyltransferase, partial [Crenarchaeota archaeon]|nr:3-phosphoshikimate 1-carboxyvinyltransferase [Thermoproteota archaeon]